MITLQRDDSQVLEKDSPESYCGKNLHVFKRVYVYFKDMKNLQVFQTTCSNEMGKAVSDFQQGK